MKYLHLMIFVLLLAAPVASAQNMLVRKAAVQEVQDGGDDVFVPISKYIAAGNSEALSAWFADNLEIAVLARESDASRAQARQIVKTFFDTYTPRSFDVTHTAGRANMKYALGTLKAGGESFVVTIFMSCKDSSYKIQQLKIERL
ncbi:MAG: DUF4783 domain-containing protein [Bacteroidales bacterium]|nr:DUF4783 domain-containing protein [Bacteroidales bacterium]MBR0292001.1 DUF4783 domain-containing protein [Bacteroidales bacterium]